MAMDLLNPCSFCSTCFELFTSSTRELSSDTPVNDSESETGTKGKYLDPSIHLVVQMERKTLKEFDRCAPDVPAGDAQVDLVDL